MSRFKHFFFRIFLVHLPFPFLLILCQLSITTSDSLSWVCPTESPTNTPVDMPVRINTSGLSDEDFSPVNYFLNEVDLDKQVLSFTNYMWKEIKNASNDEEDISQNIPVVVAPLNASTLAFPDISAFRQIFLGLGDTIKRDSVCSGCQVFLGSMVYQIKVHKAKPETLVKFSIFTCQFFRLATTEVCTGILERLGPSFYWIVQARPKVRPSIMCGTLFQSVGCRIPPNALSGSEFEWTVETLRKPGHESNRTVPRPEINVSPSDNYKQLVREPFKDPNLMKIVHLADIHIDYDYRPGAKAECENDILCCRVQDGNASTPETAAGEFGDNRKCDAPEITLIMALEHIKRQHGNDIDLIYMTGDLVPHNIWYTEKDHNSHVIRRASSLIYSHFPHATVIPCLGNHEPHPVNHFSPTSRTFGSSDANPIPGDLRTDWTYEVAYESWKQWIPSDQAESFLRSGNYAVEINPRFRVLVVNTNVCYGFNMWQVYDPQDPGGQLEWLSLQLELTKQQNRTAHIIGHVPPGHEDCFKTWSREFYKITAKYKQTIRGQFYGHTHYDEFRLLHDPVFKTDPMNLMWIGPSLTPYRIENPGYRIYHMNIGNNFTYGDILDHETWVYDLVKANKAYVDDNSVGYLDVPWMKLYQATEVYDIPNLLPSNMQVLVNRMAKDRKAFNLFYKYYFKAISVNDTRHADQASCDTICQKRILCGIVQPYYDDDDGQVECAMIQKDVDGLVLPLRVLEHRKRFIWL